MQIALHIGAHCTDEDKLLKCLLKNKAILSREGTAVPGPGRYRRLLRETIQSLKGAQPSPDAREIILDAIIEEDNVDRLVMSHESFLCVPQRVFEDGLFYSQLEEKLAGFGSIFQGDQIEIFLALRDPGTLIPDLYGKVDDDKRPELLGGVDPLTIRWSQIIARIQSVLPHAQITTWCNEDSPLLWLQLMREIGGVDPTIDLLNPHFLLSKIMEREGMVRFRAYIAENPPTSEVHLRRIMVAFLDKYAMDDRIDVPFPPELAHWSEDYIDTLSDFYEEDVYQIGRMPGVNLITP
ncbi:hypothetical protein [Nereida sp. MMG025]|uniref:hypothetical protein n=1 Tax=Nereida sp. MMG025 TaxID=2909981 RepID=UPI001F2ADC54|nr:hypothetical protein [Nereida sp. MMG025]MCF6443697.1 hypothetical protein [Nereida sp. MMG025]